MSDNNIVNSWQQLDFMQKHLFSKVSEIASNTIQLSGQFLTAPIDVEKIVEAFHIKLHKDANLSSHGMIALKSKNDIVISVKTIKPNYNKFERFTIAHEFGHYNWHTLLNLQYPYTYDRKDNSGQDPAEVFANRFGADLLVPPAVLSEVLRNIRNISELAKYFNVSTYVIEYSIKRHFANSYVLKEGTVSDI